MEFKKCARCGAFFISNSSVCCHCEPKDRADIYKLSDYVGEHPEAHSVVDLSINTGISLTNLHRFIDNNNVPNIDIEIES